MEDASRFADVEREKGSWVDGEASVVLSKACLCLACDQSSRCHTLFQRRGSGSMRGSRTAPGAWEPKMLFGLKAGWRAGLLGRPTRSVRVRSIFLSSGCSRRRQTKLRFSKVARMDEEKKRLNFLSSKEGSKGGIGRAYSCQRKAGEIDSALQEVGSCCSVTDGCPVAGACRGHASGSWPVGSHVVVQFKRPGECAPRTGRFFR